MSGHADTIRTALTRLHSESSALAALAALVAENQQLRDALERIVANENSVGFVPASIARVALRAALAGTPSEDT
jgi:hypothetical protein